MAKLTYFPRQNSSGSTRKALELAQRRANLLSLRTAGASYSEIVRAGIGYNNVSMVAQDMKRVLSTFQYETPEDVLVLDLARLDEMQKILTAALRQGDLNQVGQILRIMQFRRDTLGITTETIQDRNLNKANIQNNGIMVIQGSSTGDYVAAMAAAAGVSTKEIKSELESIAASNKPEVPEDIQDAELVVETSVDTKPRKKKKKVTVKVQKSFQERFLENAAQKDLQEAQNEFLPVVDTSTPLLSVDIPTELTELLPDMSTDTYAVPIKHYDHNVNLSSGVSYKQSPHKITPDESQVIVRKKLKVKKEVLLDELKTTTIATKF